MLNTLDTVIAFAVIMTILSLMITLIVQMVSAAFSLRGKNLANALALTFQTIDPKIGEHAHALAAQILQDPIFSDSIFAAKSRTPEDSTNRHVRALAKAQREAAEAAKKLEKNPNDAAATASAAGAELRIKEAWKALQTPRHLKPWTFFKLGALHLGNAIRPGEVYRILHEFSALDPGKAGSRGIPPVLVQRSIDLLKALGRADQPTEESKIKLQAIADVANIFTSEAQKKAVVESLSNFGATVERATTQAYDRFQRWFGSAQDRAEQWFQVHVRGITIAFSIVTAFLLQLDTIDIYRQLRDRPTVVDALVKSAPGVLEQGANVLEPRSSDANQKTREKSFNELQREITTAGFELAPKTFLGRWDTEPLPPWANTIRPRLAHHLVHLFGVLMTAGLLTLGAPFWFNLLKNLTSLRPAVATLIEKRPQSAPALPPAPATPPSSS
jgi:hypothetical protein